MNAADYYAKNARSHGQTREASTVATTGVLPERPSGPDWAVFWARQHVMEAGGAERLLDVGCAQLHLLRCMGELFAQKTGVDIAEYDVWTDADDVTTVLHNVDDGALPFEDARFDFVTMLMVLEHVFDPYFAVRELRRVVRPGGRVVLHVPNLAGLRHRVAILRGRLPMTSSAASFEDDSWDGYHIHNFTQGSLAWLLRREGLEPLEWAVTGRFAKARSRWPSLLGSDLLVLCAPAEPRREAPDFL